jgi:hypothetical protein
MFAPDGLVEVPALIRRGAESLRPISGSRRGVLRTAAARRQTRRWLLATWSDGLLRAQTAWVPPMVTCQPSPPLTSGNGRTRISSRPDTLDSKATHLSSGETSA